MPVGFLLHLPFMSFGVLVCVSWVSVFALCGFVSVFWIWVCLWPYVFVDSVYLHLWGLFCFCMCLFVYMSIFLCVCVCVFVCA